MDVWYNDQRPFADRSRVLAALVSSGIDRELRAAGYAVPVHDPGVDRDLTDAAGMRQPFLILGPERDVSREELAARGGDPQALGMREGQASTRTAATQMPGVLVELLYVSNEADAALLRDPAARDAMARGLATGLQQFLEGTR